jgi:hypothetical protein
LITEDTLIDLSLAGEGAWDSASASPGNGTYDPQQWAIVFKYSDVQVNSDATLTFKNHPSGAPVVWLVDGDVTINGTLALNGQDAVLAPALAQPGPGGFAGGSGNVPGSPAGSGFGPGGGISGWAALDREGYGGRGGSYGTLAVEGTTTYGNPSLVPLIGGSGGGGDADDSDYEMSGGAGGGAILIAATQSITIDGLVQANGGDGKDRDNSGTALYPDESGSGSGGGIRMVANVIGGTGDILATGGQSWYYRREFDLGDGGLGRIRFERVTSSMPDVGSQVLPLPSVIELQEGETALIFPPADAPSARIVSVGGKMIPADPRASFGNVPADIQLAEEELSEQNRTLVLIETANVSDASAVTLVATKRTGGDRVVLEAERDATFEDPVLDRWTVELPANIGYTALQVRVDRQ